MYFMISDQDLNVWIRIILKDLIVYLKRFHLDRFFLTKMKTMIRLK